MINNWHTQSVKYVLEYFESSDSGLDGQEASIRLEKYGKNVFSEGKKESIFLIFFRQFSSPLIYILIVASVIVWILGQVTDALIIAAVLVFNSIIGAIQEGRAQNTLLALKKYTQTTATVLREDKELIISDEDVVPGDILIIREGQKVPADARVMVSNNIRVDEASLTGESAPIHKIEDSISGDDIATADKKNMIFRGTLIIGGEGRAIVVATSKETVIGKISKEIELIDTEIPLKKDIRYLSRLIIFITLAISVGLFFIGTKLFTVPVGEMFGIVVSLAVSIVPEGLPIVLTLVLANGVWRMSKRNALVRKLQAVEALGQANILAVDKTGTITKNELVIRKVYVSDKMFEITGDGYDANGEILLDKKQLYPLNHPELMLIGKMATFCANASVAYSEEKSAWDVFGDPTEAAMAVFGAKLGFSKGQLIKESPLTFDMPFDYRTKYHGTVHLVEGSNFFTVAGAPEVVLDLSEKIWRESGEEQLLDKERVRLTEIYESLTDKGLRVLALSKAEGVADEILKDKIPPLTFVGFFAMQDSIRPEVGQAIKQAQEAGIKVVMITGDHANTAKAIAAEVGIFKKGDGVMTGYELEKITDEELMEKMDDVSVFARVTPEHKSKIITTYRNKGYIVAMTGDGVNDAPSLVAADLGIAMGKIGTEVAKEASDIVLLDDNLSSIVAAIEEGRGIYMNIKKVVLYLFSTGLGEVFVITGALFLGLPLPIVAAQIIWLNFVTDGLQDMSLAMEPKEAGLLKRGVNRPNRYLVDGLMVKRIIIMALPMLIGTLFVFNLYYEADIVKGWTMTLTTLAVFQWFNAWNVRSDYKSIFRMNPLSNKYLVAATGAVIILQMAAVYTPFLQSILHTTAISANDWILAISVASSIIFVEELRKYFYRRSMRGKPKAYLLK